LLRPLLGNSPHRSALIYGLRRLEQLCCLFVNDLAVVLRVPVGPPTARMVESPSCAMLCD
jgi:hypothetical protein